MKNVAQKINELHEGLVRNTVKIAIEIGKLLVEQKKEVGHGGWEKWLEENIAFSAMTARRYMNLYRHSSNLEDDETNNLCDMTLDEANKEVAKKKNTGNKDRRDNLRDQEKTRKVVRKLFAEHDFTYNNPPKKQFLNEIINGDTLEVMSEMEAESVHLICTSVPYNNGLYYGPGCNDNRPYQEYLDWLGKFVSQCYRVLVPGGRLIINCDNMSNTDREEEGEFTYRHSLDCDLRYKVRSLKLGLLEYQDIIWYKYNSGGAKIRCWGSHRSPSQPNFRNCKEHFIIWSKGDYKLPQPEGVEPDITKEEFEDWTYNVWKVHPVTHKNCPHPCTWPEPLTERFVKLFSFPSQVVLDPFCGSGTTCLSAKKLGRQFVGVDQNPNYCQWARDRVDGKDMDIAYGSFLLNVKSILEEKLSPELVEKKLGRYIRKALSTQANHKLETITLDKNITFEKKSA